MSNLKEELDRLHRASKNKNDWESVRTEDYYDLREDFFGHKIGTKWCYHLKEGREEEYELLQASRGNPFDPDLSVKENVEKIKSEVSELQELDHMRFKEFTSHWPVEINEQCTSFVEIGFRQPRLLKYMRDHNPAFTKFMGFDVVKANVLLAKELGFNAHTHNMADETIPLPKFPPKSVVVCYHMLEHIPDPRVGLKKIYDAMDNDSVFHVEVPCECNRDKQGIPNLNAGHLFNFAPDDLHKMAEGVGFVVHYDKFAYEENIGWYQALILSKRTDTRNDCTIPGTATSTAPVSVTSIYTMSANRDLTRYGVRPENA